MKSFLFVGATLMVGASIYGFIDYKKTSHSKEFGAMYAKEDKTAENETIALTSGLVDRVSTLMNNAIIPQMFFDISPEVEKPNKPVKRKYFNYKMFSRGALEERYIKKELKIEEPAKVEEQ